MYGIKVVSNPNGAEGSSSGNSSSGSVMLEVIKLVEKHAKDLPDEQCTANINPNPLYKILLHVERGIELTRLCIDYYSSNKTREPEKAWVEHKSKDGTKDGAHRRWRPWKQYTAEMWIDMREQLLAVVCRFYSKLSMVYDDVKQKRRYNTAEMIMLLTSHMLVCAFLSMTAVERKDLECTCAQDIAYIDSSHLAPYRGPVMCYSMRQFMESLYLLSSRINDLIYHEDLLRYLMLLDIRASTFLLYPDNGLTHDQAQYREVFKESEGAILYESSPRFLSNITSLMNAIRNKVSLGRIFPRVPATGIFSADREMIESLRAWLLARSKRMTSKAASEWIESQFVDMNLWPAEMEIFRQDYPDDICTPLSVLKKYRDARFNNIIQAAETPVADIILTQLKGGVPPQESLLLQLAMIEVCTLHFRNMCSTFNFSEFVVLEPDLDMQWDGLRREDRPRIVQAFNHFQLYYEKQLYVHDSFLSALCAWFRVMYAKCNGRVSRRLLLDEFVEQLFGPELAEKYLRPPPPAPAKDKRNASAAGADAPARKKQRTTSGK
jgi:hypothetical protein